MPFPATLMGRLVSATVQELPKHPSPTTGLRAQDFINSLLPVSTRDSVPRMWQ